MDDRIGELHLHYRLRGGGSHGHAFRPGFDRAVQAGLPDALSRRLSAMLGDSPSVIVIRELKTSAVLDQADVGLDSRVVDRISRSSADAVLAKLARDAPAESVMRFVDQTEFVGSFIVALLEGSAWGHWYFGAFRRHYHSDPATTLRTVLEECGPDAARVLGWLSRRGHVARVFSWIRPRDLVDLVGGGTKPAGMQQALDGTRALVDAAKRLLAALSPDCVASSAVDGRIEQFLSRHPIPANWTSARSLSVRVLELVRWLQGAPETQDDASMPRASADAVRELLKGPLDWLDTPWLYAQLIGERTEPSSERARTATYRGHLLTPSQDRLLEHLSADLRARKLRLPDGADEDELIVRLIGWAAAEASGSEPLDRSIVTVIEEIVCALLAIEREARDGLVEKRTTSVARDTRGAPGSPTPRRVAALRAAGPSAAELLQAAIDMRGRLDERGVPAPAAGIFLLARAVIDLRLPALANRFGVPLAPMLAALGAKWLGAPLPADAPTALWAGAESWELAGLDKTGDALRALNESLFELLVDRGALQGATARKVIAADAGTLDCRLECSLETDGSVSETACLLLRQWARWLPGVGDASPLFLLRRCVRRAGLVEASDEEIFVHLEPAPLDVVLEMAGYLATIERVAWLGDRSVRFSLLRLADA